ncbi:MAG: DNA primase [Parcubacteria group bacterium]|nr:DNA primase [Parcubacteria group bacterium]
MTDLEQIKERIDIVELVQGYMRLQKAGINYKGLCPFHNEKTPSFMVSPSRQIWHCFGCSKGGDAFKFLMEIEGLEFKEALERLAKRAGIELKHFNKEAVGEKTRSYQVVDLAAKFFEKQLWESDSGKKALKYLRDRGLKDETLKEWRLGYAPNTWNSLKVFLKNAGYSEKDIFASGLTVKKNTSDYYDRFRGRIMFPIADLNSQVVGFTGRIFEEVTGETEMGKYINTPQTAIYDKSRLLYGLDKAKMFLRKNDRAIVVEGNMDVLMSHQAGVENVVASSGTALTPAHLKILGRYTRNVNLCFDQDAAGETAAKRGIDLALSQGFNVGIINLANSEKVKDPADLVKENPAKWQEASQKNQPIVQFYIEAAFQRHDPKTALGKKNIAMEVLPVVKMVENKVEQAHWISELSNKLKVEQKVISRAMAEMKDNKQLTVNSEQLKDIGNQSSGRLALEETLLALLLKMPEKSKELNAQDLEIFQDKFYNELFERLKRGAALFDESIPYEDRLRFELVKFKSEQFFGDLEQRDLETEISRLFKGLKKELILEKIKDLEMKIKQVGNQNEVPPLLKEVKRFSNKLSSL